jgi:hypothetical protein
VVSVRRVVANAGAFPWHPVLFAVIIVATAWFDAAISPYAVFRPALAAILVALTLTLLGALAFRSVQLGGVAATLVIWALWSKQLLDIAANAFARLGSLAFVWLAAILIAVVLAVRVVRRRVRTWSLPEATSLLNRAATLLLIATLLVAFFNGTAQSLGADLRQGVELSDWAHSGGSGPSASAPDIYVILLDGYPRSDVLDYAFDVDNSAFTSALEARGFEVAPRSHSDYLWTHVSVPSALNLAYIEQIPGLLPVAQGRAPQQPTIRRSISNNTAFRVAHDHGYDTVAVASGFEQVAARQADVWIDGGQMTEFEVSLLASTFAGDVVNVVAPDLASSQHRARVLSALGVLPQIAVTRARPPAIVFSHVPAPHQPTVFGADGAPVAVPITPHFYADSPIERSEDADEFRERYRTQLPFLNGLILAAIDEILTASEVPPVIVLFADHGSASRTDWNATDPATVDRTILLERTGTLFAALTPGHPDVYPDDVSPVDLFRLLFDAYFGTDYGRAVPPEDGGQIPPVDASVFDRP